jgi:predicted RNA-binding protein with PUA-like domain
MSYFLFKSEPGVYSFDDLVRDGETVWDGVTNPTAVKNLREMKPGSKWIFYHTGDDRTAVGTGTVVSVDATDPKVPIVRVKAGKRLKHPKTLAQIKAEKLLRPHHCSPSAASPSFRSAKSSGSGLWRKGAENSRAEGIPTCRFPARPWYSATAADPDSTLCR